MKTDSSVSSPFCKALFLLAQVGQLVVTPFIFNVEKTVDTRTTISITGDYNCWY